MLLKLATISGLSALLWSSTSARTGRRCVLASSTRTGIAELCPERAARVGQHMLLDRLSQPHQSAFAYRTLATSGPSTGCP
jgi:hypothetical protein